ncbi:MAG: TonB-dependent receptor [Bacteroidetes bacterium]|nr:TonB-dependent receptor [Bacteroidota bacterium]MCY4204321.1 TonB-dependent receptor [Bacteroidota bacterium]
MKKIVSFLIICGGFSTSTVASQELLPTIIQGLVVDVEDEPIAFVNIQIEGTKEGASTGQDGRFEFITAQTGQQELLVTMIGFDPNRQQLNLVAGDSIYLRIILKEAVISLDQIVVTSSGYSTGESEGVTIQALDVVTTPGAAADILLAIQTFPGTSMVDEGAGLFVRGGDLGETLIVLDQATLSHPYKYESPTGGVFGVIPPFMIRKTAFSTGGFSSKYGNALSAVLDMSSLDMPRQHSYTLNLGLAAASLGIHIPIVKEKIGVRFTGNRSFTEALFRLNGQYDQFSETPNSSDVNTSLQYKYSTTGSISVFGFLGSDQLGVHVNLPSLEGEFRGKTTTSLFNIQWEDFANDWYIQTSLSLSRYSARQQLGDLDMNPSDIAAKFRSDAERYIRTFSHLRLGVELERLKNRIEGVFPSHSEISTPIENYLKINEAYDATRLGAYSDLLIKLTRRIVLNPGIRADYHSLSRSVVIDPRISFRYAVTKTTDVRFAWGIYHQFPTPFEYNSVTGNADLGSQHSQHFVLGLDHENSPLHLRLEAYYKPYYNLVLRHSKLNYTNQGKGKAGGVDIFAKYGGFLQTRLSGWISYSYNRSVRLQARSIGNELIYERASTSFEILHNLTIVAKARLVNSLYGGTTIRYATGRPVTHYTSSIPAEDGDYYLPIEGPIGAERLPSFQRMDIQLSYYLPFGEEHNMTFYTALANALDRANVTGYDYSADYSERTKRISNYRRYIYLGVSISINR